MGLRDKAKALDFTNLGGPAKRPGEGDAAGSPAPKTAPGAMMAFALDKKSDLLAENERLKAEAGRAAELQARADELASELRQWDDAKATKLLDPARIIRSRYANRHELNFSGRAFDAFCDEIASAGGNVEPIKVRPVRSPDADYEVVYGHRRHAACLARGLPVLALIDNVSDRDLFVEMERENRERRDLSPWEQGRSYQQALEMGLFPSNRKLAEAIGLDLTNVGKALALARLPPEVVDAFPTPMDLQYRWAKPLGDALERDMSRVLTLAKEAASKRGQLSAKAVLDMLAGADAGQADGAPDLPAIPIKSGRKQVAVVGADRQGKTVVQFDAPLSVERRRALAEVIQRFLAEDGKP